MGDLLSSRRHQSGFGLSRYSAALPIPDGPQPVGPDAGSTRAAENYCPFKFVRSQVRLRFRLPGDDTVRATADRTGPGCGTAVRMAHCLSPGLGSRLGPRLRCRLGPGGPAGRALPHQSGGTDGALDVDAPGRPEPPLRRGGLGGNRRSCRLPGDHSRRGGGRHRQDETGGRVRHRPAGRSGRTHSAQLVETEPGVGSGRDRFRRWFSMAWSFNESSRDLFPQPKPPSSRSSPSRSTCITRRA